jgi:dihydrofolate reductase
MGKLVVSEFISLDGVIDDPGGADGTPNGGWSFKFPTPDGEPFKFQELLDADVLLLGRRTYEGFAAAWPAMEEVAGDFAKKMNSMPKVVVSTTLTDPAWQNTTVISEDVAAGVSKLKEQYDGDILVGGSSNLVDTLRAHNLVDEYRLMVHPIVLGQGKRLFNDATSATALELVESRKVGPDVVLMTYRPVVPAVDATTAAPA